jgi:hypothetical protein
MNAAEEPPITHFVRIGARHYGDHKAGGRAKTGATFNNIAILSQAPA